MASQSADWHLLFGLLALQNGLVSREQLVAAFAKWTSDKSVSLDEVLVSDGALDQETCDTLRQMVELHVERHGGDPQQSLMNLPGSDLSSARRDLEELDDSELNRSILQLPEADVFATTGPSVGQITSRGGRFRILRPLAGARGGMGEISVAKDEELGRQVALKQILSDKADHAAYRQKFHVEAEITGNLEHPGIVPVYGLGAGPDGRPYYAMRLVHGDNLSAKIRQFHEGPGNGAVDYNSVEFHGLVDRLIDVAQAVRYAHSRGVLHRDLKPGNILVGEYGETLVIDWGLARLPPAENGNAKAATSDDGIDAGAPLIIRSGSNVDATMQGQALGTPGYAPPEQLNGRVDLITERSDVYALGAILYQILVDEPPITSKNKDLGELIKDTIVGKITPPRSINRSIPKSLSAICMQTLEREPADRYESVEKFIEEVERWKADQPVHAVAESLFDKLARFGRKHRAASLAALATILGIAIAATAAAIGIERQRQRAELARTQESRARQAAEQAKDAEAKARNEAEKILQIVSDSFKAANPKSGATADMLAKDVLLKAKESLDSSDLDDPGKMRLLRQLNRSFFGLGEYNLAIQAAEEWRTLSTAKLGADHPKTLASMGNLAIGYSAAGRTAEAITLGEQTLALRKAQLGADHPDTLWSMGNLAIGYWAAGRTAEAITLGEQTLELTKAQLGADHPDTLAAMGNLAIGYAVADRTGEAITLWEQTLELTKAQLGADHPDTLASMGNLAIGYNNAGRTAEAITLGEQTLELMKAKLGADHPDTLAAMAGLANAYLTAGRTAEAITLHEQSLALTKAMLGADHRETLISMNALAVGYRAAGRTAEAITLDEQSLALKTAKLGADHRETLISMNNLVWGLSLIRPADDRLNDELMGLIRSHCKSTQNLLKTLAAAEYRLGNFDKAISTVESSIKKMPEPPRPIDLAILAMSHFQLGHEAEAKELREKFREAMKDEAFKEDQECLLFAEEVDEVFGETQAEGNTGSGE